MRDETQLREYDQAEAIALRLEGALLERGLEPDEVLADLKPGEKKGVFQEALDRYKAVKPDTLYRAVKSYGIDAHWLLTGEQDVPQDQTQHLTELFLAFMAAREAFLGLENDRSDDDPDGAKERAMRHAGEKLNDLGGKAAMVAAYSAFFPNDESRTRGAGSILNQKWTHIGEWLA